MVFVFKRMLFAFSPRVKDFSFPVGVTAVKETQMTTYSQALAALAALEIAGVRANYGPDAPPVALAPAALPALIATPLAQSGQRLFAEQSDAFAPLAFHDGPRHAHLTAMHLLLAAPAPATAGEPVAAGRQGDLVTLIDAVLAALRDDLTLGGLLAEPLRLTVESGVFRYGGAAYLGCAFRHRWVLAL
jgi:hypothetical protein